MSVFESLLDLGQIKRRSRGRPRLRPEFLLADRAYSGQKARNSCLRRRITLVVPPKKDHKKPHPYDKERYRKRNQVERLMNRLKRARRIATRFEKRARYFTAMVTLACVMAWL